MKKSTKKLSLKLLLVIVIWIIGVQFNDYSLGGLLEIYVFLIGIAFVPIIFLYAYRYKKKLKLDSLHKVFRFFVWLFIVALAIHAVALFISGGPYYFEWWDLGEEILSLLPPLIIILLLFGLFRINKYLVPKK